MPAFMRRMYEDIEMNSIVSLVLGDQNQLPENALLKMLFGIKYYFSGFMFCS